MAGNGTIFWLGANGNIYAKGPNGQVNDYGTADKIGDNGAEAQYGSIQGTRIADPNPPKATAPPATTSQTTLPDKSGDIAYQTAGLNSVDGQTAGSLAKIDASLAALTGQYDTEAAANTAKYKTSSDTNQNNLQKNKQTAEVNAAQGRQGLNGTLASLGALNGSGVVLANRAVQNGANADLNTAGDTFSTNQSSLDDALSNFKSEDQKRRDDANNAGADAKTNTQNEDAKTKQTYYSNLASDYDAEGDTANAVKFRDLASSLFPTIAATNIPSSNITPETAAYTSPTLASYLAGNSTQVQTTPAANGGNQPGLVATSAAAKKKQLQTV